MTLTEIVSLGLVIFLAVGIPVWDRIETPRLRRAKSIHVRTGAYQRTVAWLWLATGIVYLVRPDRGEMFQVPEALLPPELLRFPKSLTFGLVAGMTATMLVMPLLARWNAGMRERALRPLESIGFFLPRTRGQRFWFAAVSVSAGFCEEVIYRAFLLRYFAETFPDLGIWVWLVASVVLFGVAHGYQGVAGVLGTTFLAALFFLAWFASGTLWVPIAVHALLDLRVLMMPEPGSSPAGAIPRVPAGRSMDRQ